MIIPLGGNFEPVTHAELRIVAEECTGLGDVRKRMRDVTGAVWAVNRLKLQNLRVELSEIGTQTPTELIEIRPFAL